MTQFGFITQTRTTKTGAQTLTGVAWNVHAGTHGSNFQYLPFQSDCKHLKDFPPWWICTNQISGVLTGRSDALLLLLLLELSESHWGSQGTKCFAGRSVVFIFVNETSAWLSVLSLCVPGGPRCRHIILAVLRHMPSLSGPTHFTSIYFISILLFGSDIFTHQLWQKCFYQTTKRAATVAAAAAVR